MDLRNRLATVAAAVVFVLAQGAESEAKIVSSILGSGGAVASGGSFKVRGAVAPGALGTTTSASNTQRSGFWPIYQVKVMLLQLQIIPGVQFLAADGASTTTVTVQLRGFGGALTANNTAQIQLTVAGDATGGGTQTFSNGSATFTVQAGTSPSTITLTATVTGVEDGEATFTTTTPVKANSQVLDVLEDRRLDIVPSGSGHGNLPLSFTVVTLPTNGSAEVGGSKISSLPFVVGLSKITYRPNADYNGSDQLRYSVTDGRLTSGNASVSITITPVNDKPVLTAVEDQILDELQPLAVAVNASDVDADELTITVEPLPDGATFDGTTIAWTPETNQGGVYPVSISVVDATGSSATANFTLTVNDIFQALFETTLDLLDFGQVRIGEEKIIDLPVSNSGNATLNVASSTTTLAAYAVEPDQFQLPAGENITLQVTYTPEEVGDQPSSVSFESNAEVAGFLDILGEALEPCGVTDFNCDGELNLEDFFLFADVFAQSVPPADPIFDLNGDAVIGYPDLFLFADSIRDDAMVAKVMVAAQQMLGLSGPYDLRPNYPNPFNSQTNIDFALLRDAEISIVIYDALGQRIRNLVQGEHAAGYYQSIWDGRDDHGRPVGNGVYLYRLQSPDFHQTRKLLLLK